MARAWVVAALASVERSYADVLARAPRHADAVATDCADTCARARTLIARAPAAVTGARAWWRLAARNRKR